MPATVLARYCSISPRLSLPCRRRSTVQPLTAVAVAAAVVAVAAVVAAAVPILSAAAADVACKRRLREDGV